VGSETAIGMKQLRFLSLDIWRRGWWAHWLYGQCAHYCGVG